MPKIEDLGLDLEELRLKARMMVENTKWYQENKKNLRENFSDKYVAIFRKEVIASSEELDKLKLVLKEKGMDLDLDLVLIEFINPKGLLMIF